MPICASVRRTGRGEVSAVQIDLGLLGGGISAAIYSPAAIPLFLSKRFSQRRLGQRLLELARLCPQSFHLVGGGLTGSVAGEAPLARFQALPPPAVLQRTR